MLSSYKVPRDGKWRYVYDIWQPLVLLVIMVLFTAAFFAEYNPYTSTRNESDLFFCNANGKLEKTNEDYKPFWDAQLFFTINIAFGEFSFSRVKIIDAAWDAVVGRGGQFVAALVAYRTLRRSTTLTMETYTIAIPAVASIYCRQIQLVSVGQLLHSMVRHRNSVRWTWRQSIQKGSMRLCAQLFVCVYVLLFATLVSIMTGYRAELSAFFRYDGNQVGQLYPIGQLLQPRMVLYDGSRVELANAPIYAHDPISYPSGSNDSFSFTSLNTSEFITSFRHLPEPIGALLDCRYWTIYSIGGRYANHIPTDHFTCKTIWKSIKYELSVSSLPTSDRTTARSLKCPTYDCSCSAAALHYSALPDDIASNMTSTIVIGGQLYKLPAPPLDIGLRSLSTTPNGTDALQNVTDFWRRGKTTIYSHTFFPLNETYSEPPLYLFNETSLGEDAIKKDGRCVAAEAYSWGFSSLLLLTFCCYTIAFALALILLQTDVYWNSRYDRGHQSHSIYTDVIYLAEGLKNTFGQNIEDHMLSSKAFDKRVQNWKQGIRVDVRGLPLSRWQEWRLSRATERADRKAKSATTNAIDSTLELRDLSSRNLEGSTRLDTAYRELMGGDGDESSLQVDLGPDRRFTTGELAPSLGDVQASTEGSVLEGSIYGDAAQGHAVREELGP